MDSDFLLWWGMTSVCLNDLIRPRFHMRNALGMSEDSTITRLFLSDNDLIHSLDDVLGTHAVVLYKLFWGA